MSLFQLFDDPDAYAGSSKLIAALDLLKEKFGIDYRVQVDAKNVINCVVWMTPREKVRLKKWGDVLFFDGLKGLNEEDYCFFVPTILGPTLHVYPAAHAAGSGETTNNADFILKSMDEMVPEWKKIRACLFADDGVFLFAIIIITSFLFLIIIPFCKIRSLPNRTKACFQACEHSCANGTCSLLASCIT